MKRIAAIALVLFVVAALLVFATGASNETNSGTGTYKIELDNSFGLVNGEDFKVAGVVAGSISSIDLDRKTLHAIVTVHVSQGGFGSFHKDAFCQSRPQSLIGEYFINCDPGTRMAPALPPGSTIPITQTSSTVPADLLQNIMRMPYRTRLTLLINELGAGVSGRSGDLQAALDRAVPALTETDNLLRLLGNDAQTLKDLTSSSNAVITALANNSTQVARFVTEANNTATDTATQQTALKQTFHNLPGFLEQLRPALSKLDAATTANEPVLANLNAASGQLNRLFTDLPGFANSARPALKSLGQASVTGKQAVDAAGPTIRDLNQFAKPTPELAQNLKIVLNDLDTQSRAVERDPRSPGGVGFSGLQALLGYVFNQTLAINTTSQYGHMLTVDAFVDLRCTPYATPSLIATNVKVWGKSNYRNCYSWLGPNQPGVNETDPTNPKAPVPDPGGAPPGHSGPATSAAALAPSAASVAAERAFARANGATVAGASGGGAGAGAGTGGAAVKLLGHHGRRHHSAGGAAASGASGSGPSAGGRGTSAGSATAGGTAASPAPPINLGKTVGTILGLLGLGSSGSQHASGTSSAGDSSGGNQTQQLLNYLLAP